MAVKLDLKGEVLTAYLEGDIDLHSARKIRSEIDLAVEKYMPSMLVLDFFDVTFMDSSGIGLVMGRYKLLKKIGIPVYIQSPSVSINKILQISGIYEIMPKI